MKTLIATALVLASSASYAHDNSFSSDNCNVELHGGININDTAITFSKNKSALYTISGDNTLLIKGDEIALNSHQKALLHDYSIKIRQVVPEVKSIALDAIDLAIDGVNLAFDELLGHGNNVSTDLTTQLTNIRSEVDSEFKKQVNFYIDEDGFSGKDFFGDDFEQRIETAVENTLENSLGTLMIAVGQEMLMSGGDMDAFGSKMEKFGEQIEYEMEMRSEGIEKRGEALCQSVIAIDELEERLKDSIDELAGFNLLTASAKNHHNEI